MKAIALDPLIIKRARQGKAADQGRVGGMKRRVERGCLWHIGVKPPHRPDQRKALRLMQRRKPRQRVDLRDHLIGDPGWSCEDIAAMHNPMADHRKARKIEMPGQPGKSLVQHGCQIAGIRCDRA